MVSLTHALLILFTHSLIRIFIHSFCVDSSRGSCWSVSWFSSRCRRPISSSMVRDSVCIYAVELRTNSISPEQSVNLADLFAQVENASKQTVSNKKVSDLEELNVKLEKWNTQKDAEIREKGITITGLREKLEEKVSACVCSVCLRLFCVVGESAFSVCHCVIQWGVLSHLYV